MVFIKIFRRISLCLYITEFLLNDKNKKTEYYNNNNNKYL